MKNNYLQYHFTDSEQIKLRWYKTIILAVLILSTSAFIGWLFDIEFLKRPLPGQAAMNPLTALCFLFSTASLFFLTSADKTTLKNNIGDLFALIVLITALMKLTDVIFNSGINPDTWLFYEKIQKDTINNMPNRMAPNAAVGFVLTSIGLLLLNREQNHKYLLSQFIALSVGIIGLISVLGYLYNVQSFYGAFEYIPMAIHSAIGFFLLSIVLLLAHSNKGFMKVISGNSFGALTARKLIPAAFIVPVVMGLLRIYAAKKNLVSNEMGITIMILSIIIIFLLLIWIVAYELNIKDALRKQAEEKLEEYKHFFNNSNDFSCIANLNGYFEVLNPKFHKVLNYYDNELFEKPFLYFVHPDDIAVTLQEIEKLQNGAITTSFINRYRKKDGTYLWFEWNTTPNKATGRLYAIARDITERKKFEEQLINTNQELESFSYSVSHDLRAPLRAVNGYAQILKEEFGSTMDKEAKRLTERIMYSAQKMGQLIDDLLTFSRLSRKELVKTTIEMNKLVAALCMEIRNQYPAKNIQFNIKNLHDSEADPVTIKQVWINLINNAVKYSRHNDNILIEIGSAENDNYISYYISDNGVGFDMQYYDKLFGVFQRLHSENEFEGTGVGLAIVKRIISKHDGIVRAEGKLNKGATFYFTLPK